MEPFTSPTTPAEVYCASHTARTATSRASEVVRNHRHLTRGVRRTYSTRLTGQRIADRCRFLPAVLASRVVLEAKTHWPNSTSCIGSKHRPGAIAFPLPSTGGRRFFFAPSGDSEPSLTKDQAGPRPTVTRLEDTQPLKEAAGRHQPTPNSTTGLPT
ncbi:hypothetical protein VDGL01_08062 [Verticillium dahliae]